jgi:hypothetical protein
MSQTETPDSAFLALPWYGVWAQVFRRPTVTTYVRLLNAPDASRNRAYKWVFWTSLVSTVLVAFLQPLPTVVDFDAALRAGTARTATIFLSPAIAAAHVLFFALLTGIVQLIARTLGGTGTFTKLAFALASCSAPLSLLIPISVVGFGRIPLLAGLAGLLVGAFGVVLQLTAIRAVNSFGWAKALVSLTPQLLVGFASGIMLAGQLLAIEQSKPQSFRDDGITITYPATWVSGDLDQIAFCQQGSIKCLVQLFHSSHDGGNLILVRERLAAGLSVDSVEAEAWRNAARQVPTATSASRELIEIDGLPAVRRVVNSTDPEAFVHIQISVISGTSYYVLTASAPAEEFAQHQPDFDYIIRSMAFIQ